MKLTILFLRGVVAFGAGLGILGGRVIGGIQKTWAVFASSIDGRRIPIDEKCKETAHAYSAETVLHSLRQLENFLRFLSQAFAKRFCKRKSNSVHTLL